MSVGLSDKFACSIQTFLASALEKKNKSKCTTQAASNGPVLPCADTDEMVSVEVLM